MRRTAVASPVDRPVTRVARERLLEVGLQAERVRIALAQVLAAVPSRTAARPAENTGRRLETSGRSSRTCFIATDTWFSPWNGTSPVSIS